MLLPPSPIGQPPGNTFWNDWYEKLRNLVNGSTGQIDNLQTQITALKAPEYLVSSSSTTLSNERVLSAGTNTTVDFTTPGQAKVNVSTFPWASVTGTPTTLSGYGVTQISFSSITLLTTSGSGANTATLTNSPVSGNPTKWIQINDNGTTRYIPAW